MSGSNSRKPHEGGEVESKISAGVSNCRIYKSFFFPPTLLSKRKDRTSSAHDPGTVRSEKQQSVLVYSISCTGSGKGWGAINDRDGSFPSSVTFWGELQPTELWPSPSFGFTLIKTPSFTPALRSFASSQGPKPWWVPNLGGSQTLVGPKPMPRGPARGAETRV